jgi:hypothetical protein
MNEGGPHAFASSSLESDCSLSESKMTPPARAVNKTNNQSINQSITKDSISLQSRFSLSQ